MRYHITHDQEAIFFWLPKSGVISLAKLLINLKIGSIVDNEALAGLAPFEVFRIFRGSILQHSKPRKDYSRYKKLFFGRNPYHRILSCWLDKYVSTSSVTPGEVPPSNNFLEFMRLLGETGLEKDGMKGLVDYGHFCAATDDICWQFYQELGCPEFDYVSLLPETAVPEDHLTHDSRSIRSVLDVLGAGDMYESIRIHYEGHACSLDTWQASGATSAEHRAGFHLIPIPELRARLEPEHSRTITYSSFYPDEMEQLFRGTYGDELRFYQQLGHEFRP